MNRKRVQIITALALSASGLGIAAHSAAQEDTFLDDSDSGRVRSSITPRVVPPTHTVSRGDTLWDISGHYYGNPWDWPRLWSYNPEITNPHWIYPLDQVRLIQDGQTPQVTTHIRPTYGVGEGTLFLRELGYLDGEALERSGEIIGSPTDHMLLAPFDSLYVRFDGDRTSSEHPQGEYTIYRTYEATERMEGETGTLVRILGTIRIDRYDEDRRIAEATLTEALDPIERGYRVAAIPRRFDVVPPVVADRDLETTIVASLTPQQLVGEQQVIFVPVGEDDGVRMGNRFYVTRRADEWRRSLTAPAENQGQETALPVDPEEWPEEVIAEGRVVSLRPHSAGLWITRSVQVVEVGEHLEMREGY
jgi:hypothetical protein